MSHDVRLAGSIGAWLAECTPRCSCFSWVDSLVPCLVSCARGAAADYRVVGGSYELVVRYTGPGMNECRIRPRTTWNCGGYF